MTPHALECPSIHVSLLAGADPALFRWVEIGAEEEGLPARLVPGEAGDVVALAYQAAQGSRLSIGVGISDQAVVLHEPHMPAGQPVLSFKFSDNAPLLCRLMGANAARMVVHRPLHIDIHVPPPAVKRQSLPVVAKPAAATLITAPEKDLGSTDPEIDPAQLVKIIVTVVRKLQQRGE